jgi:hypothetical protein
VSLTFDSEAHRYTLTAKPGPATADNPPRKVSGVTGLIEGGIPKPELLRWLPKFTAQFVEDWDRVEQWHHDPSVDLVKRLGFQPEKYKLDAGERGSAIHTALEQIMTTGTADVDPQHLPEVNAMLDLYEKWDITPLLVEKSVANRTYWYSGRFDLIGKVGKLGGRICQIDTKSSNGVYGSMSLQLAASAKADFWVDDDDPDTEYAMPEIEQNLIAHVHRDKATGAVTAGLQSCSGGSVYDAKQSQRDIDEAFREFLWAASIKKTAGARSKRMWPAIEEPTTNHVFREIAS